MKSANIYIILTGVHERKVFDLYNILTKNHRQFKLLLFDYKDTTFSLPVVYGQKVNKLPNNKYPDFETALLKALEPYQNSLFIYFPLLDNYNGLFYEFMKEHPSVLTCSMPTWNNFNTCIDKIQFQQFCESHKLPVPVSFVKADIAALRENFRPLIIKPKTGAGSVGISFIKEIQDLDMLEELDFEKFLVQERIDNIHIEGGFFLFSKGEMVSYYGHRRIRVFPVTGGVTVYSEYHHNQRLKETGSVLLKKLDWNGFAMVEFLYDAVHEDYKIIEVNPRLWGSLLLSEFAHTGFIENYINICLQRPVKDLQHRTETKIRWFYPFDILLYLKKRGKIEDFWSLDRKNTCYINFTYASFFRAIVYMIYFTLNINSIKRFYKKISPGSRKK